MAYISEAHQAEARTPKAGLLIMAMEYLTGFTPCEPVTNKNTGTNYRQIMCVAARELGFSLAVTCVMCRYKNTGSAAYAENAVRKSPASSKMARDIAWIVHNAHEGASGNIASRRIEAEKRRAEKAKQNREFWERWASGTLQKEAQEAERIRALDLAMSKPWERDPEIARLKALHEHRW